METERERERRKEGSLSESSSSLFKGLMALWASGTADKHTQAFTTLLLLPGGSLCSMLPNTYLIFYLL